MKSAVLLLAGFLVGICLMLAQSTRATPTSEPLPTRFVAVAHGSSNQLAFALSSDGRFFWLNTTDGSYWEYTSAPPGGAYVDIISTGGNEWQVLREDGAVYEFDQHSWALLGQLPGGGVVSSRKSSFGAVKAGH
jgi:hypothetical protein